MVWCARQMIRRISEQLLLRPEDVKPLRDDFVVIGVFNPGAVRIDNDVVLVARVAEKPLEYRPGFVGLPRWNADGCIVVDWVSEFEVERSDPRVVRRKADNLLRLTSISHLRVFRSRDGNSLDWTPGATFLPESPMEEFGVEDPRITQINGRYLITYVAVSRYGAATALASTEDLQTFARHGVIFCPENKDVVLFPQQVKGQYVALHRPNPNASFSHPQIWLARSPDLLHWGQHECLFRGSAEWEGDRVGAGVRRLPSRKAGWKSITAASALRVPVTSARIRQERCC